MEGSSACTPLLDDDEEATLARYSSKYLCALLGRQILEKLKGWYRTLCDAEHAAHENVYLRGMLQDLVWPTMQWPRMLRIGLQECGFKS
eukprot:3589490-Amphidinium_carterae.1